MHLEPAAFLTFESCGTVTTSELLDGKKQRVVGGLLCPRLWPTSEASGMAHVPVPHGLVHPELAGAIGERLGLPAGDVLAVARGEAWLDGGRVQRAEHVSEHQTDSFAQGLVHASVEVEALIVRRVPVIAPALRPLRGMPGGAQMPDPISYAYMGVINLSKRLTRIIELAAPDIIVALMRAQLQAAFEKLIDTLDGKPDAAFVAAKPVFFEPVRAKTTRKAAAKGPCGAAFAGNGVLVSRGNETVLVRPGAPPRRYPTPVLRLYATSLDGKLALFKHAREGHHHLLDLETGSWLDAAREGFPRALVRTDKSGAHVVDLARQRERPVEVAEAPPPLDATSPDNRFVWVASSYDYGGIYDAESGDLVAWPVLAQLSTAEETDPADDAVRHLAAAFAHTPRDMFRFFTGGRLFEGDAELPLPSEVGQVLAAAFDASGDRLLLASREEAVIVELGKAPAIIARYPL
jgi:hypothetical protein